MYSSGSGNITVKTSGTGAASAADGVVYGGASSHQTVNKHDQTMEMAQNFLRSCPDIDLTVDASSHPDYLVLLNREGTPIYPGIETGQSQIMVLNRKKNVIYVSKKATVKNATKGACNALISDWQANGRIELSPPPVPVASAPTSTPPTAVITPPVARDIVPPSPAPVPQMRDVALSVQVTAAADKRCKTETITTVRTDTMSYLTSKGLSFGTASNSKTNVVLIIDRPFAKWLEVTVQGRDSSGNVLWSQKVSNGSSMTGTGATLDVTAKIHEVINQHF